jgi:hypothetical protein
MGQRSWMVALLDQIESLGWRVDISLILLIVLFAMRGPWGFIRLARAGLSVALWIVALGVTVDLTTLILQPTPGPYTVRGPDLLVHAAVIAVCVFPWVFWGIPRLMRTATQACPTPKR